MSNSNLTLAEKTKKALSGQKSAKKVVDTKSNNQEEQKAQPSPIVPTNQVESTSYKNQAQNLENQAQNNVQQQQGNNKDHAEPKTIFGLELRSVLATVGLALFFVMAMSGALIAWRQRMQPEKVSTPTAPKSKPAAAVQPSDGSCTIGFTVAEEESYECNSACEEDVECQTADEDYVCYNNQCRLDENPTDEECQPEEQTFSCNTDCSYDVECRTANSDYICSYNYGNVCRLAYNPSDENCEPKEGEYACNSICDTNEQCQTSDAAYICYNNRCRLDTNPVAENCQPPIDDIPTAACNMACSANADCVNSQHICYNGLCRLSTYPESKTCSPLTTESETPLPVATTQPELPEELPESGAQDIVNWLKAAAGILGIGTVLLLLL